LNVVPSLDLHGFAGDLGVSLDRLHQPTPDFFPAAQGVVLSFVDP